MEIQPKLLELLSKDPKKRITIDVFKLSGIFTSGLNTKEKQKIGVENLNGMVEKIEDMHQDIKDIKHNLDKFLPAIQENLKLLLKEANVLTINLTNRFLHNYLL